MIQTHKRSSAKITRTGRSGFSLNRLNHALCLLFCILFVHTATADVIYLRNGRKLNVERAWEEGDRIRYVSNGNVFGFSRELVERIESGLYRPDPREAVTPSATERQQSVPVEVLDETLTLGDATGIDDPEVIHDGQLDQTRLTEIGKEFRLQPANT
ncbi:MAG: hypothetical protein ACRD2L_11245, partial [Terriglobia bacterium]